MVTLFDRLHNRSRQRLWQTPWIRITAPQSEFEKGKSDHYNA